MADTDRHDAELKAYFEAARRDAARLPAGYLKRVRDDARAVQADAQAGRQATPPGVWAQLREALGGWPGLGGLAAACAVGIWLGLAPPALLPDPVDLLLAQHADAAFDAGDLVAALAGEG